MQSSTHLKFNEAWTFPEAVEKHIADFISEKKGRWLHAPVGTSKLHKEYKLFNDHTRIVTLDINNELKPDLVCDIFKMSEHCFIKEIIKNHGGFDGVVSDPIWYDKVECKKCKHVFKNPKGLAYPERRHLLYQLRDVLKPGGWLIFNALWRPTCKGLKIIKQYEIAQAFSSFRNSSLLYYCQRTNERITDE